MINIPDSYKSRMILISLVLVCAAPVLGAWLLYNYTDVGKNVVDNSYGSLIKPPQPLPDLPLKNISAGDTDISLRGKWTLLYRTQSGQCDAVCGRALEMLHQIRASLGKDAPRLQRVLALSPAPMSGGIINVPLSTSDSLLILNLSETGENGFAVGQGVPDNSEKSGTLYLVDPLGNLMMVYPSDPDPAGIIRDLKRLLRYSRTG